MGWALCPALSMAGLDKIKKVGQAFVYEVLCPLFFRLLSLDFFFFFLFIVFVFEFGFCFGFDVDKLLN